MEGRGLCGLPGALAVRTGHRGRQEDSSCRTLITFQSSLLPEGGSATELARTGRSLWGALRNARDATLLGRGPGLRAPCPATPRSGPALPADPISIRAVLSRAHVGPRRSWSLASANEGRNVPFTSFTSSERPQEWLVATALATPFEFGLLKNPAPHSTATSPHPSSARPTATGQPQSTQLTR